MKSIFFLLWWMSSAWAALSSTQLGSRIDSLDAGIMQTDNENYIASRGNEVFIVYVKDGQSGGVTQSHLFIRHFRGDTDLGETLIANNFAPGDSHEQPSVGIDDWGYIWVAGNMHNDPWQIWRSDATYDISSFTFKGQDAGTTPGYGTFAGNNCSPGDCQTNFLLDEPGIAAVPGNQITYAVFFQDRNGKLYLTARECGDCSAAFDDRNHSSTIYYYTAADSTWRRIGDTASHVRWFNDTNNQKRIQGLWLYFDASNYMHAVFKYGNHYAYSVGFHKDPNACIGYAWSNDGGTTWYKSDHSTQYTMPITPAQVDCVHTVADVAALADTTGASFYLHANPRIAVNSAGNQVVLVWPGVGNRGIRVWNGSSYNAQVDTPYSGGRLWQKAGSDSTFYLSSGFRVHATTNNLISSSEVLNIAGGGYYYHLNPTAGYADEGLYVGLLRADSLKVYQLGPEPPVPDPPQSTPPATDISRNVFARVFYFIFGGFGR